MLLEQWSQASLKIEQEEEDPKSLPVDSLREIRQVASSRWVDGV